MHKTYTATIRTFLSPLLLAPLLLLGLSCDSPGTGPEFAVPTIDGRVSDGEYTNSKSLDGLLGLFSSFKIYWSSDDSNVYIALRAKTEGFVAVGFQPRDSDKKQGVDFIIGYVSGGQARIFDLFSNEAEGPHQFDEALGGSPSVLEFAGTEQDGYTTIEFKRALDSGDPYDLAIEPGTLNILWAYSEGDSIYEDEPHRGHRGYGTIRIE